uniref:JmjC domain-containing protein n=1 Tax=Panagrolaimus sp. PS1159 TaxID=55785 RepID=A0AC35GME8_9BILA
MQLPDGDFTIDTIVDLVGRDEEIQVIDVYMQESNTMSMGAFYDRWKDENRERLYNMLSFEFSRTKLMKLVKAPKLMCDLSWVHRFWPPDGSSSEGYIVSPEDVEFKPDVAMFCLLGMGGSYTDFHIDFGGSSVWYHVYRGKKVFYVIQPSKETLAKFVEWTNGPNRSEKFFVDLMPPRLMKKVEINEVDNSPDDVIDGFRNLVPYLKKWVQRDKEQKENYKLPNIFRNTIPRLEKMIRQYDKDRFDYYEPESSKPKKNLSTKKRKLSTKTKDTRKEPKKAKITEKNVQVYHSGRSDIPSTTTTTAEYDSNVLDTNAEIIDFDFDAGESFFGRSDIPLTTTTTPHSVDEEEPANQTQADSNVLDTNVSQKIFCIY